MLISERIYKFLSEKGMTQKEFAVKTGISQSTISDWRRKGTNPSADKILIICDVLDISPYELLSDSENPQYKTPEYFTIDKNSKEYKILECYKALDTEGRGRIEGYLNALNDLKKHV